MKIKHIFTFVFCSLVVLACDDPDCIKTGGSKIKIGFYSDQNGQSQNVRVNSLTVKGLSDALINSQIEVNSVILPLNPSSDRITAYFDTEYGFDTLIIGYSSNIKFISAECGIDTAFNNLYLIRRDFDSVKVVNKSTDINFLNSSTINENIKVYN